MQLIPQNLYYTKTWQTDFNVSCMQARTSHSTEKQKQEKTLKTWMSCHCTGIVELLHGHIYCRDTVYIQIILFLFWIIICVFVNFLLWFCTFLGNILCAAIFKSLKLNVNILIHDAFHLPATLVLKSIGSDWFLITLPKIYACSYSYTIDLITLKMMKIH